MQAPQVFLALFCVALGVFPALAFQFIGAALNASKQGLGALLAHTAPAQAGLWVGIEDLSGEALLSPLVIAAVLGCMMALVYALARAGGARRRPAAAWLCGYVRDQDAVHYQAHHLYTEFKRYFRWVGGRTHAPSEPKVGTPAPKAT
jgi:hypothetical protein